jgi:hypothetical protein
MATTLTHTWTTSVKDAGGTALVSDTETVTGNDDNRLKDVATAGQTKHISVGSVVKANITSFFVESDQNVTLKINSSTTPDQTISLTAKRAYAWKNTDPGSNPLSPSTVTDLYFVNAGSTDANVTASFLQNN